MTMSGTPFEPNRSRLAAILRLRCPRCREGRVFARGVQMNPACPVCGLKFEREPGYFVGAMYFSYGLSVAFMVTAFVAGRLLLPDWPGEWVAGLAVLAFLPFVPMTFRYSRVIWIHYDRWLWPGADFFEPPASAGGPLGCRSRAKGNGHA
jgi:uncharacterized protein (DUF983 family)